VSTPLHGNAVALIFALTYLGIVVGHVPGLKLDRTGIVTLGAIGMMVLSGLSTEQVIALVQWPTLLLLFSFFVLSAQLRLSGFLDAMAEVMARRLARPGRFLADLMLTTAALSAVLNHDVVCLVFVPFVISAVQRRGLPPVPYLIALALASNIGAAATLVGNPQGMLIAQVGQLDFGAYVLWSAVPVALSLLVAWAVIWRASRAEWLRSTAAAVRPPNSPLVPLPLDRPHTIKGLVILVTVIVLFFGPWPKELIALTAAGIHLASPKFRTDDLLRLVDWPVLLLFMGLFVVTGAFQASGQGELAMHWLAAQGLDLSRLPTLAWVTAGLSNLINNSAAVMLLLKVAPVTHAPAAYVLSLANSFGGSLLIVGSVSNIIVVQQAQQRGVRISLWDFARLGVPVTLSSLLILVGWASLVA
jgi:Na+/H+ antiporter NhaD/arsenite permease-like protein